MSTACNNKGSDATSTSADPAGPVKLAGTWRDAVGDAPWQTIELSEKSSGHGHFAGYAFCAQPPCGPRDQGDYDFDGKTLRIHVPSIEGQSYRVHIGGDVMEWRQNDVMIRRFKQVEPAPPQPPQPPHEDYPSKSAARPPGTPCDTLTAQGCLLSKECVLEAPDRVGAGPYVCRPARGPCEGGVAEADPNFEADCKARKAGCTLRPPRCFCPNASTKVSPDPASPEAHFTHVSCFCGGGPVEACVRK